MGYLSEDSSSVPDSEDVERATRFGSLSPSGLEAIERLAAAYDLPKEVVHLEFCNAWNALVSDAKFPDYLLVLTEKRTREALRRKLKRQDAAE